MPARSWLLSAVVAVLVWPGAAFLWPDAAWGQSYELRAAHQRSMALFAEGRYRDAMAFAEKARALAMREFGPGHPATAAVLNQFGGLYRARGRYDEAERSFTKALAIYEDALGPDHPNLATALGNLAGLYRARGRYDEAGPLLRRALAIRESALGPGHPGVARMRIGLAILDGARDEAKGPMRQVYRGAALIALPPERGVESDVRLVGRRQALASLRAALDVIYRESLSGAEALGTLKKVGRVIIVYDPRFPSRKFASVTNAAFVPDVAEAGIGERRFLVVVGRYGIKRPPRELGGIIVHELVGHGVQHLRGRLTGGRKLDVECEASLYELGAYQDFKIDKLSPEMVAFRRELEERNCADFKRYMREVTPALAPLWDAREVDVPRLLAVYEDYVDGLAD